MSPGVLLVGIPGVKELAPDLQSHGPRGGNLRRLCNGERGCNKNHAGKNDDAIPFAHNTKSPTPDLGRIASMIAHQPFTVSYRFFPFHETSVSDSFLGAGGTLYSRNVTTSFSIANVDIADAARV